jgi:F-type H+-transporting ATPase subunit b
MLEINWGWFIVQVANFLILLVLLNRFLFKPLLNLFRERDERTTGSLKKAKEMEKEREDLFRQIEAKLSEARDKSKELFEGYSKEGIALQKSSVETATEQSYEMNKKARENLESEVVKVKDKLRSEVEAFSSSIVEKMIGV